MFITLIYNNHNYFKGPTLMSPMIDINLDDTPDKLQPVEVGIRILKIIDVTTEDNAQGEAIHIVELQVDQLEAPDHERKMWDRFNFKFAPARTKFKQLVKAAGHSGRGSGVDPSELIGCTVKASVKPRTYKDKDTDETVETTQVSKYLFDST